MNDELKIKIVPELRFPEFEGDGDWEEKCVNDFFEVASSKRVLQKDWIKEGVPFYRTRELVSLSKNEPFGSEIYISEELFLKLSEKYGVPKTGDFLVSGVGTLGILYQVNENDKFYFKDGNVIWFKLTSGIVSDYFKHCFHTKFFQKQIFAQSSASTVGTYTINNARKTKFWKPVKKEEQQKIANCLSSLDNLITAETEKLDCLKDHKKGLLQQLFPANGETKPQFRFPEFKNDGDWEEKELGEIAKFRRGSFPQPYGLSKWYDDKNGHPFVQVYDVAKNLRLKSKTKRQISGLAAEQSVFIEKGTVIITIQGSIGRVAITQYDAYIDRTLLLFEEFFRPFDKLFFAYVLQTLFEIEKQNAPGGIIKTITKEVLTQFKVFIPKINEQKKIGGCLSSADDLIEAQTTKIEALKDHKKGLMQQLFPNVSP